MENWINWIAFGLFVLGSILYLVKVQARRTAQFRENLPKKDKETVRSFVQSITNPKTGLIALKEKHLAAFIVDPEEQKKVEVFPFSLTPFMQKLNVIEVGQEMMKVYTNKEDSESLRDICRAITIASALYGFEIPLLLLAFDKRTIALYQSFLFTQQLREIPKMIEHSEEKEKELQAFIEQHGNCRQYIQLFPVAAKALLYASSNGHYAGFPCYSSAFNRMNDTYFDKKFSHEEIRSVTTAFAAVTFMQIPLSYISLDNLTYALLRESNPIKQPVSTDNVVSLDAFRKKETADEE